MEDYGCTTIEGNLFIRSFAPDSIYNLTGLSGIIEIKGKLQISANPLSNLSGLNDLVSIGGDLIIEYHTSLSSLNGLEKLESIGGNLDVHHNEQITSLSELESISFIGNDIDIAFNSSLESLNGLIGIKSINGSCKVTADNVTSLDFSGLDSLNFVGGSLLLSLDNSEISNLNVLNALTKVEGDMLLIGFQNLSSIGGFNKLDTIREKLYLPFLFELETITGFNNLNHLGGLSIQEANKLQNLEFLSNIKEIRGDLGVSNCPQISTLDGLNNINKVGGNLSFSYNGIQNIHGLDRLTFVGGRFSLRELNLTSLEGLNALNFIGNSLSIIATKIIDIDPLSSLEILAGSLNIRGNTLLTNLDGLRNVVYLGGYIKLDGNISLGSCCIPLLLTPENDSQFDVIQDNLPNCNSLEEIRNNCTYSLVHLDGYNDTNGNGLREEGESNLRDLSFSASPETTPFFDVQKGQTFFYVFEKDDYTFNYVPEISSPWETNASITLEIDEEMDTTISFPMTTNNIFTEHSIDLTTSITRCFRETNVWLTYFNEGTQNSSGYVSLEIDDAIEFISAEPGPDSITNNTLYWYYEDLPPTHSNSIDIMVQMPDTDFIGEEMNFYAEIESWEGEGLQSTAVASDLICAYDPNDKLVFPEGVGDENYTLFEDSLFTYTIRFQNTGNDTAFNVLISDKLSDHLDLSTFRFIASSHDVIYQLNEDYRQLSFDFLDIYLPDSNINEQASHGFVKYSIESNQELAEETAIENTAAIFFDFNPAIITNTTENLMVSMFPVDGLDQAQFSIFPNPTTGKFTIQTDASQVRGFRLYNNFGQLLESQTLEQGERTVEVDLQKGIYYIQLDTAQGYLSQRILIH